MTRELERQIEAKRALLNESGQAMRRELVRLIELIDAGEYARVGLERGDDLCSAAVDVSLDGIKYERQRRERIIAHLAIQTGRR